MREPRSGHVTADDVPTRSGREPSESLRQPVLDARGIALGLGLLLVVAELVGGWRVLGNPWMGGDLLYHSALANEILRGQILPGGPYAGLPTYYPPGFHLVLAATMAALGLDAARADQLLTLIWLPVLPIGTFLLARWLTGRPGVALLAAALTVFAGGYDLAAGRLWVNSLFPVGQEVYPLYPRDVVFGMLPFAVLAFLVALETPSTKRATAAAILSAVLFGACAVTQVQLLLPLPIALVATALVVAIRRADRRRRSLGVILLVGGLAALMFASWFVPVLALIRQNGGVALGSSDMIEPARFGPWSYPREFGLLLPLAVVGSGVALLFLRRPDGPRPGAATEGRWRPMLAEGPLLLVVWFVLAFLLAVAYQPDWPLEDALRPQRLWLLSSQPMTILAAMGLVTLAEDVVERLRPLPSPHRRRALVAGAVAAALVIASVPTTLATTVLLHRTWTKPTYAHLDLTTDHVPDFASLLPARTPQTTVLTYEDWSSLVWFETGETVVGLVPAGFAKLAFDPAVFTQRSQDGRRSDLLTAFDGDPSSVASTARAYGAEYVVLARRGSRLAILDASAATAALAAGATIGRSVPATGNGWDGVGLEAGASLDVTPAAVGDLDLEIRLSAGLAGPGSADAADAGGETLVVAIVGPDGAVRSTQRLAIPAGGAWEVVHTAVRVSHGDRIRFTPDRPATLQSVRGFADTGPLSVGASPVPGWRITAVTDDAVVLEPAG